MDEKIALNNCLSDLVSSSAVITKTFDKRSASCRKRDVTEVGLESDGLVAGCTLGTELITERFQTLGSHPSLLEQYTIV